MTYNTIVIKGHQFGIQTEYPAASAISPGDFVELLNDGTVQRQSIAGGRPPKWIAREYELFAKGITTDYAALDYVQIEKLHSGMEVYASVAANAPAIVIGDYCELAGDGTIRKVLAADAPADLTDASGGSANGSIEAMANPTDAPATADNLRDDIVANLLPAIRNNFAEVAAQLNKLTPGTGTVWCMALEALDNSAIAAKGHVRVEVL